jgi:hypothetical protein
LGFGFSTGGFAASAEGAESDLGGVKELGGLGRIDGAEEDAVGDTGDKGVDGVGVGGEVGHGAAVGAAGIALVREVEIEDVFDLFGGESLAPGLDAALDGGFGCGWHGRFLS